MNKRLRCLGLFGALLLLTTRGASAQTGGETPTYTNVQVVSIDAAQRTLVIRNSKGQRESLVFDDLLASTGGIRAGDRVIVTVRGGPGRRRVSAIALAGTTATVTPTPVPRQGGGASDHARLREVFARQVASISQDARGVDASWASFVTACKVIQPETMSGSRDWFGLWDTRIQADYSNGFCRDLFNQMVSSGEAIKKAMAAAESVVQGTLEPVRDPHSLQHELGRLDPAASGEAGAITRGTLRVLQVAGAVLVAAAIGAFSIVQLRLTRPSRLSAQEALLTRQNQALLELTAAAEKGTLLDFKDILVVVDQSLIRDLLRAVTPMDADVGKGFHVRVDSADTAFGDGVALVRMSGVATIDDSTVGAQVTVFGAIDAVQIDPRSGVLRCNVNILGVEAQDAKALGRNDPIGRLTEALAHGGLALLLEGLEIPVRVEDRLSIPAVTSKRLQIMAEHLPLTVSAQKIKVFGGKLWIFVDVALKPKAAATEARS